MYGCPLTAPAVGASVRRGDPLSLFPPPVLLPQKVSGRETTHSRVCLALLGRDLVDVMLQLGRRVVQLHLHPSRLAVWGGAMQAKSNRAPAKALLRYCFWGRLKFKSR
jgi:hypothetical protein